MPGVHSKGQTMIGCWCHKTFVERIDRARGARTRSQFCREAIADKLRALGVSVPEYEANSPDRAGKGGPKRMLYRVPEYQAALNESNSPSPAPGKRSSRKKSSDKS